jgi:hypothetical protein
MDKLPVLTEVPPFDSLLAGSDGTLWARRQPYWLTEPQVWRRVRGSSGLPAVVELPERFRTYDIGFDFVAGVRLDDLGTESVEVLVFD